MRYFIHLLVVVLTSILAVDANAASTWQRQYEADKIPEEAGSIQFVEGGTSEWTLSKAGSPELNYVSGGVFHHEYPNRSGRRGWEMGTSASGDGDSRWDASAQTTFEMRAQMIQDCDGAGADWYFADGDNYYMLNFKVDAAVAPGGDTVPLDLTSDFFTVRVAIDGPSDNVTAYFIDAGSNEATLSIPVRGAIERNYVFFSGLTSNADVPIEMEIDYMRWTNEGAFDFSTEINPIPEPTGIALVLIGLASWCLIRRRK